jgi:hypothetical protein
VSEITALISNRNDFAEGETGNNIGDGGGDMYFFLIYLYRFDGGNILNTNFQEEIEYTDGAVLKSKAFGQGS